MNTYASAKESEDSQDVDGPIVKRRCPQYQNDKMFYGIAIDLLMDKPYFTHVSSANSRK